MKGSSYRERDYSFGQVMLTLRTKLELTQAELADQLGVRRRAVIDWEGGLTYPSVDHLKRFVILAIQRQAWPAGREAEEVRALWQAAHQKALLDEAWLRERLSHAQAQPASQLNEEISVAANAPASPSKGAPRVDWGEALAVASFYGRAWELDLLSAWVVGERCQVVSVLGQGGIGKSALATKVMHRVAEHFEVVIWRSLRDVPSCEALLDSCLQVLAPQALSDASMSPEKRQDLLLECLRTRRVLLVYDNLESFLEEGEGIGSMRAGYEGFSRVLRRVATTEHQSCLLLTSREKPGDLVPMEGNRSPVRALRLARLDIEACQQLLEEKEVTGTTAEQEQLIEAYAGNPLALKIVAQAIVELFDGHIAPFLEQGEVVFGGIRQLLREQYARLSAIEQRVLLWLAILREPVSLEELLALLATPLPRATMLEAVEALLNSSLIEQGLRPGSVTLQSVVLEYATAQLIEETSGEIQQGQFSRLIEQSLTLARSPAHVRQTQVRLIVVPLLLKLRSAYPKRTELEDQLLALLKLLRARADYAQGYGPANVLALLKEQRGHLRGLDLSDLSIREAYLQGVEMQDTTLSGATLQECAWTSTFGAAWSVAISHDGRYHAAGSRRGEICVWDQQTLHRVWRAHSDIVRSLSFSPDGHFLASGSYDGMVNVWGVEHGALLWLGSHTANISGLAFSPDGSLLASGGIDATVRLWDRKTGALLETLPHPHAVFTLAWSPDGHLLASFGFDGQIRLWKRRQSETTTCVACLSGHTNCGMGLAFSPDGSRLASASWDHTIKLWDVASGDVIQTLMGHTDRVQTVAWSPDGQTLASAAFDHTIWLWDMEQRTCRMVLQGHTDLVFSLAFMPNSRRLLSGSVDGTMQVWDTENGQSEQILQSYAISLYDIAWSPDGTRIASGSSDGLVMIWEVDGLTPPRLLQGHRHLVFGVEWSPDGRRLASGGWDNAIRVWDTTTGESQQIMRDPDDAYTSFYGIAWSPDGQHLACGTYRPEVQMWEVSTGTRQWMTRQQPASARRVAWSPDGTRLASAGDDGLISLWNPSDGRWLRQLRGHLSKVNDIAWSRDGKWLASGGGSRESGEVFVWEIHSGERVRVLPRHAGIIYALAWGQTGAILVSGSSDGMLRWWDRHSGECVRVRQAHQGTVQRLQVSPDGKWLASCGDDGAIHLWDLESGNLLRTLQRDRPYERLEISGAKGLTQAQRASLRTLGAQETQRRLGV
ncbi:eIF2A-related protein [Ktedonobacter racemifer]|uniref:Transcriptional regulator, XRE family n=1 Tax=Ktedonobacter racemifer DSM 44963 TaxID=485913 RepID=D6U864_KTERA|nr:NB-ARC domain-containing protein [Ktedonobacter racemifer]EFH80075.1 transcriptional regulator, XRE family [Ktedonobacter racemifer DSM 44963]